MRRFLAFFSLVGTFFFAAEVLALLLLARDVDPVRLGISFYALGRFGLVINLALGLIGVSGIALAVALWPTVPLIAHRVGVVLLAAWGIAQVMVGLFPVDPPGVSPTLSGSIHNVAASNFLLIAPAVLLIEMSRSNPSDRLDRPQPKTLWLAWLLLVCAALLFTFNGPLQSLGIGGAIQRLYWLVLVLWLLFKGSDALRTGPRRQTGESAAARDVRPAD